VASRAGVSIATVSRAVNGIPTVDPELARRVWKAVEEVGYLPNTQARALVSGRSRMLGLIVSEITNPFFPELIQEFENLAVEQGYEVLVAARPEEGLQMCKDHPGPIDVLLTDVVMPGMSGPALAKRLGTVRADMKVLCMSGYTDDSIVRHGVLEAEIAYIQKPITPDALTTRVRQVLEAP